MKRARVVSLSPRCRPPRGALLEPLELRQFLSAATFLPPGLIQRPAHAAATERAKLSLAFPSKESGLTPFAVSPPATALTPAQVRSAYGLDQVMFGDIVGDGAGQTIAVVVAYHYPTAWQDLQAFSAAFGLPDPPSFQQVAQDGSSNYPPTDPAGPGSASGTWALEAAMDLQWAHAMAPAANLILVEANDNSYVNLITHAVHWARNHPDVSVISMSFGGNEFSGELNYDQFFTTPAGHQGISFLAATGDNGDPGSYPAYSPNVVAVGGTSLTVSGGNWSESGWSGSGGGISLYQGRPAFQAPVTQSSVRRTIPDLSLVGDPNTGVAVFDSWDYPSSPWVQLGGTSLSTPLFAGVVAVANQGRVLAGKGTLHGAAETLPALYTIPWNSFRDVTAGNNGFAAAAGYDLVTGRGSPKGPTLVAQLVGAAPIAGSVYQDNNGNASHDSGEPGLPGVTVFLDTNGNGSRDVGGSVTQSSGTLNLPIPDNSPTGANATHTLSNLPGLVSSVSVTLNVAHTNVGDLVVTLIGPDGTAVTLVNRAGGQANDFTALTLDDAGFGPLAGGTAPFSGSFFPEQPLAAFAGKDPNGTWTLKVVDAARRTAGTLLNWSITVSTPHDQLTTSAGDGTFSFSAVRAGATLRTLAPAAYVPSGPAARPLPASGPFDFGLFPTAFTLGSPGDILHLWLDPTQTKLRIGTSDTTGAAAYEFTLAALPALTFTLAAPNARLIVDFTGGSPLPAAGLALNGGGVTGGELVLIGSSPSQVFSLTDTALTPSDEPAIGYSGLSTLTVYSSTIFYTGALTSLQALNINAGTTFYWG